MTEQERIQLIEEFVEFCKDNLQIEQTPKMTFIGDHSWVLARHSFGEYDNHNKSIVTYIANRNLADILRTIAHELTHHKQNELGQITAESGKAGSDIENEANSMAGILMRQFGKSHDMIYESISSKILINAIKNSI
jgi:Zn-dependent peptidase ImmA (M78 family)